MLIKMSINVNGVPILVFWNSCGLSYSKYVFGSSRPKIYLSCLSCFFIATASANLQINILKKLIFIYPFIVSQCRLAPVLIPWVMYHRLSVIVVGQRERHGV